MQSEHYTEAKKNGLRELLRQMQRLMTKGEGDKPMDGEEVSEAVETAGDDAEHEVCEQCEGEGCEHCESDESTDVNAAAEDDSEEGSEDEAGEPDFKQEVRDYLAGKGKVRKPTKSLVVKPQIPSAGKSKSHLFQKGEKKRA